jgi:hypothetical protein
MSTLERPTQQARSLPRPADVSLSNANGAVRVPIRDREDIFPILSGCLAGLLTLQLFGDRLQDPGVAREADRRPPASGLQAVEQVALGELQRVLRALALGLGSRD